ncbi:MAG: hypothetical protein SFY32_03520 [Bacteroidota bacterium]|nr:hypothetical protein [Bacteroidota bacterium]
MLTSAQLLEYQELGYTISKSLFSNEETDQLYSCAGADNSMQTHGIDLNDQSSKKNKTYAVVHTHG